jgi:hypothetical protein
MLDNTTGTSAWVEVGRDLKLCSTKVAYHQEDRTAQRRNPAVSNTCTRTSREKGLLMETAVKGVWLMG